MLWWQADLKNWKNKYNLWRKKRRIWKMQGTNISTHMLWDVPEFYNFQKLTESEDDRNMLRTEIRKLEASLANTLEKIKDVEVSKLPSIRGEMQEQEITVANLRKNITEQAEEIEVRWPATSTASASEYVSKTCRNSNCHFRLNTSDCSSFATTIPAWRSLWVRWIAQISMLF